MQGIVRISKAGTKELQHQEITNKPECTSRHNA